MKKPYGVEEFDGYPMPKVPRDRKPLPKETEDKMIAEALKRLDDKIAAKRSEASRKIG
ncbi:MAG: hypothetical protein NC401_19705 [Ruminococcus sp.]|nr:hypothetical protein [Ruminococcus sp.]